jgi:Tfp pilus assembly protein PilP
MTITRLVVTCAAVVLLGWPARAQTPAALAAAPGVAAQSTGAPAGAARPKATGESAAAAPSAQPSKEIQAQGGTSEPPPAPAGFTYNPEDRRDPFVSLATRGSDVRSGNATPRPPGLAGLDVSGATLKGTLRIRDGFVAMLQGPDQKTYIVRPGDKLFAGTVSRISQNDLVIVQQVNDPLSLEKQREVRKGLRQAEAN